MALSGIIIQNEQDYLRAQTEVDSADIRSPVALIRAPKSDDSQGGAEFSIITPSRLGLFSKDEAVRDRSELDGRREQRSVEIENYQKVFEKTGEALVKIRTFTSEFSRGRMKQIHEELAAAQELLHQAEAETKQLSRDLADQETEKESLRNQKSAIQTESQKAQGHQQTLISFYRDHDQKIEGNRKTASLARQKEESAKLSLVDLRSRQGELEQSERRLNEKATSQHSDWNLARKEKDRLPQQYIGEPVQPMADSIQQMVNGLLLTRAFPVSYAAPLHLGDRSISEDSSSDSSTCSERGRMGFRPRYTERCPEHRWTISGRFGVVGIVSAGRLQRARKSRGRSRENSRGFCCAS